MSFGLSAVNAGFELVTSTATYNLHYIGRATYFSSTNLASYPPAQYDSLYIQSDTAPVPFIVNRPGRSSTILSVSRDLNNPQNWNIITLTSPIIEPLAWNLNDSPEPFYGTQKQNVALKSIQFRSEAPPQVLCFAKLPATHVRAGSHGLMLFDESGRVAFDSNAKPLNSAYVGQVTTNLAPVFTRGWARSSSYVPGAVFANALGYAFPSAYGTGWIAGSSTTPLSPLPAAPAFFYAGEDEAYAPTANDLGTAHQAFSPVLELVGNSAVVSWASRAALPSPPASAFVRGPGVNPLIVIDASKY